MSEDTPLYNMQPRTGKYIAYNQELGTSNSQPVTRNPEPGTQNPESDTAILIEGLQGIITKADNITFSNMSVTAQSIKSIDCFLTDILKQKM